MKRKAELGVGSRLAKNMIYQLYIVPWCGVPGNETNSLLLLYKETVPYPHQIVAFKFTLAICIHVWTPRL